MKICFLTPTLGLFGGTLVMLKYAGYLAGKGHEVVILCAEGPIECPIPNGVEVCFYPTRSRRYLFYSCELAVLRDVSRCLDSGFDVVIPIYTPLAVHAVYARWRRRLAYRIVLLYQDSFGFYWVGKYLRFILARKRFVDSLDKVIAVSSTSAREFESVSRRTPEVISNGIDDAFFEEYAVRKGRDILFVGRPNPGKGFDHFEKAMYEVAKCVPDLKGVVVSSAVEDGTLDGFRTVRYRSREQLGQLYAEALVYVHACGAESFGLPPVEAMACGTAAVVTRSVGTLEYARDSFNCLMAEYGDYKGLAGNIIRLANDHDLRQRLERNGRATAMKYRWRASLEQFEAAVTETGQLQPSVKSLVSVE
jgi:glycosyltransferase involved in cell wall biosynthesis